MIAVIDTNHLLRIAAAYQRSPLFAAWMNRRFTLVVSTPIMVEIASVITRKKTQRFLPEDRGYWLIETLQSRCLCHPCRRLSALPRSERRHDHRHGHRGPRQFHRDHRPRPVRRYNLDRSPARRVAYPRGATGGLPRGVGLRFRRRPRSFLHSRNDDAADRNSIGGDFAYRVESILRQEVALQRPVCDLAAQVDALDSCLPVVEPPHTRALMISCTRSMTRSLRCA